MRSVTESITINTVPEFIWPILLSSHEYENWNPIYSFIEGFVEPQGKLTIEVDLNVEEAIPYLDEQMVEFMKNSKRPPVSKRSYRVTSYREPNLLAWKTKVLSELLFSMSHRFELSEIDGGSTLLKTTMTNSGFLSAMMPEYMFRTYHQALCIVFNKKLKWYVEEGHALKHEL